MDVVVIDEAHRFKNPKSVTYQALYQNLPSTCARILLTGTPLQNDFFELQALYNFATPNPGNPGNLGNGKKKSKMLWRAASREDATEADGLRLRRFIHPCLLRRSARAALSQELPPLEERIVFIALSSIQRVLYNTFLLM